MKYLVNIRYVSDRPTTTLQEDEDGCDLRNAVRPSFTRDTNIRDLKALFGIYYYAGVMKLSNMTTREMFNRDSGITVSHATMSEICSTQLERHQRDCLAPIRECFDYIMRKSVDLYVPSGFTAVDKQLVGLGGCCPFKMYMPLKA